MPKKDHNERSCERWALERIDDEAKLVRIEFASLSEKYKKNNILIKDLVNETLERFEWWDTQETRTKYWSIATVKERLVLDPEEALIEGMVFWVIKEGDGIVRVIHATETARELSKKMYKQVLGELTSEEEGVR